MRQIVIKYREKVCEYIHYGRLYKILMRIRINATCSYFTRILSGKFPLNYLELAINWRQNALNQGKELL